MRPSGKWWPLLVEGPLRGLEGYNMARGVEVKAASPLCVTLVLRLKSCAGWTDVLLLGCISSQLQLLSPGVKEIAALDGSQGALISESQSFQELMGESPEKGKNNPRTQVSDDLKQMTKQMTGPVDDSSLLFFQFTVCGCVYS